MEWNPVDENTPRDGTEFQGWVVNGPGGFWEPRCRFNPDTEALEMYGRVDYDQDGWESYPFFVVTHWMPQPADPREDTPLTAAGREKLG